MPKPPPVQPSAQTSLFDEPNSADTPSTSISNAASHTANAADAASATTQPDQGAPTSFSLASSLPQPPHTPAPKATRARRNTTVLPAPPDAALLELAASLPPRLRMGTSSWHFPGWAGLVWDGDYAESTLSRAGLAAYAAHPLLRSVSLDRAFYRPLSAQQYAHYAAQVPDDFRFVVKGPSLVCDALVRAEDGRGMAPNPVFLNTELAVREFIEPALQGLGHKAGALVFQLSPLPRVLLNDLPALIERIGHLLAALPPLAPLAPDGVIALEVRDAAFLTPAHAPLLAQALRAARQASDNLVTYCLGLHAKMPPIEEQLPLLRALWPGPLVCRWNLHRRHGAYGYESAKAQYAPFDRLQDPDPETRTHLARVITGTCGAGQNAYVTINNKAEGSAPLSVLELGKIFNFNNEIHCAFNTSITDKGF